MKDKNPFFRSLRKAGGVTVIIISGVLFLLYLPYLLPPLHRPHEEAAWKETFAETVKKGGRAIPKGWVLKNKPGTPAAVFYVERPGNGRHSVLHMEADKASGSLLTRIKNLDIQKTPLLRWRWRADALPSGADGRNRGKDDQAIGIYIGTGNMLNMKSVSYRWDTDTPKGTEGTARYGGGAVKVKWITLRDKGDAGKWFVEERDCAEDFYKAWGFYPDTIYLSVSCNSQYTGTDASADLDWIEFNSGGEAGREPEK